MKSEDWAAYQLTGMGYDVCKLPEGTARSPDFLVKSASSQYLIELKTKHTDARILQDHRTLLDRQQAVTVATKIKRENGVSAIVRDAARQLSSRAGAESDFRVVWLHSEGEFPELHFDQFVASLYGSVYVVDVYAPSTSRPCYFFMKNDFHRFRAQIDAAIVSTTEKGRLCLNNFSPRYRSLRQSDLVAKFGNAVTDPVAEEQQGRAYILDTDSSRDDSSVSLKLLQVKYANSHLMHMETHAWQSMLAVSC